MCQVKISEVKREYQLQEWSGMLRERKESGLSAKAWCSERGITEHAYYTGRNIIFRWFDVAITLHLACQRDEFPWWAQELLDEIDATFIEKIEYLRRFL